MTGFPMSSRKTHQAVALIPARGGSKRIPGKNVRLLGGHPLLAYSIRSALESGIFGSVIVSTDCQKTAEVARHYGAAVPFLRPAELAGDMSPDIEWLRYTIARLQEAGTSFDAFSILRPTSPLRTAATIQRAFANFNWNREVHSLRAVELCAQHPGKMWVIKGEIMEPLLPPWDKPTPMHSSPYQALPRVYVQNASLEIAWTDVVTEMGSIAGTKIVPFVSEGHEGFDLNQQDDWILLEHMIASGSVKLPRIALAPYKEGID